MHSDESFPFRALLAIHFIEPPWTMGQYCVKRSFKVKIAVDSEMFYKMTLSLYNNILTIHILENWEMEPRYEQFFGTKA